MAIPRGVVPSSRRQSRSFAIPAKSPGLSPPAKPQPCANCNPIYLARVADESPLLPRADKVAFMVSLSAVPFQLMGTRIAGDIVGEKFQSDKAAKPLFPAARLVTFTNSLAENLRQTPPIQFKISVTGVVAALLLMSVLHASTRGVRTAGPATGRIEVGKTGA